MLLKLLLTSEVVTYLCTVEREVDLPTDAMPNGTATLMPRRTVAITAMKNKHEDHAVLVTGQYIDYLILNSLKFAFEIREKKITDSIIG